MSNVVVLHNVVIVSDLKYFPVFFQNQSKETHQPGAHVDNDVTFLLLTNLVDNGRHVGHLVDLLRRHTSRHVLAEGDGGRAGRRVTFFARQAQLAR